jgi:hypothetical protein
MRAGAPRIPTEADWAGHEDDLDVQYAYKLLFGKTVDEVVHCFVDNRAIERAGELGFVPRRVFQYYVFAFVCHLESPASAGDSDCASVFLRLLYGRETSDPGSVSEIYPELRSTVDHVAENQAFFDAPLDIYRDFRDLAAEIRALCE